MIAVWMVYAVVVAAVIGIAAAALESVIRGWGPTRWVWATALIVSVSVPTASLRSGAHSEARPAEFASEDPGSGLVMEELPAQGPFGGVDVSSGRAMALPNIPMSWSRMQSIPGALGRWATGVWVLLSGCGLVWILLAVARLRRRRRTWRRSLVNGRSVLLTANTGPAVVGLLKPEIVLPSWTVRLGEADRELMLRHEEEHRRAGDPWLITAALGLLVCLPWNLPLWWQLRRLRLAIEVDCDHRVLGGRGDVGRYGALLLELGVAGRGRSVGAALAFARPMPFLERRIRVMTTRRVFRPLRSLTFVTLTGVLVLAACRIESPPSPAPLPAEPAPITGFTELPFRASVAAPPSTLDPGLGGPRPEPPAAPDPRPAPTEIPAPPPSHESELRPVQEALPDQQAQEAAELQRLLEEIQEEVRRQASVLQELSRQFEENSANLMRLRILSEQLDTVARQRFGLQLDSVAAVQGRAIDQERNQRDLARMTRLYEELARRQRVASDSVRMMADSVRALQLVRYDSVRALQARMADSTRASQERMFDSARAMFDSARAAIERRRVADEALVLGAGSDVSGRVIGPDGSTPLPGVSVTVSAPEFEVGAVTVGGVPNGVGRFLLRGVPPGQRVLVFQHPDHGRWEVEVEILEGEATVVGDVIAPGD